MTIMRPLYRKFQVLLASVFFAPAFSKLSAPLLDEDSFDKLVKSKRNGMVRFFQPWCGHCTRMKPAWDALYNAVAHPSVFIGDVDCSQQSQLCQNEGIVGYPTIKVYIDGTEDIYRGPRGFELLYDYTEKNLVRKCDIHRTDEDCTDRAISFIEKWKFRNEIDIEKEIERLRSLESSNISWSQRAWIKERKSLLKQMVPN